ncbi:MAG: hypothetical protein H6707_09750 [Deltaproteobacteria bacterium]|nr:hypothetical protein [Deltaproteobacteria bacterium]
MIARSDILSAARCERRWYRVIDALAGSRQLSERQSVALWVHLRVCPSCRQRYNQAVLAARMLEGGPEALRRPSTTEINAVKQRLFADQGQSFVPATRSRSASLLRWLIPSTAAALALVIVLYPSLRQPEQRTEFAPRGAATASSGVGMRVFCVEGDPPDLVVRDLPPDDVAQCSLQGRLKFAYSAGPQVSTLTVVAIDQGYRGVWRHSQTVAEGRTIDQQLTGVSLKLQDGYQIGLYRVFAIFAQRPIGADELGRALVTARQQTPRIAELRRLPIKGTLQRSTLVEVVR